MDFIFNDPGQVEFAKPATLTGKAHFPEKYHLSLDLAGKTTGPFAIRSADVAPDGTVTLDVIAFEPGQQVFPALDWTLTAADGTAKLTSPPVRMTVAELKVKGPLRDIKPPFCAPWWLGLLAVLTLAAAAWATYALWRRFSKTSSLAPLPSAPVDDRPPHVVALEALNQLEQEAPPLRPFYERLAEIVRIYLERRFGIPASYLTTGDLLRQMRQAELEAAAIKLSREVLEECDLVKFAKHAPDEKKRAEQLGAARRLVEETSKNATISQQADAADH